MDFKEGEILHINKPYGMTSFGALAFVRTRISKAAGVKRVKTGHAGTLDPLATGVLILCTGKKTKLIPTLQEQGKEYTATLQLGATTASYDMEHPVDATYPTDHITEAMVREALEQFRGNIMQVPPTYSAVHIDGKRAYEIARKVEDSHAIEDTTIPAKPVNIKDIELLWYDDTKKQCQIRVECGKGTYIRSLARDIGKALNSGAYLTQLCRTRVGDIKIENCIELDKFQEWLNSHNSISPSQAQI